MVRIFKSSKPHETRTQFSNLIWWRSFQVYCNFYVCLRAFSRSAFFIILRPNCVFRGLIADSETSWKQNCRNIRYFCWQNLRSSYFYPHNFCKWKPHFGTCLKTYPWILVTHRHQVVRLSRTQFDLIMILIHFQFWQRN